MIVRIPTRVFVPFEWDGKRWVKRDDIPRFLDPFECGKYLQDHPELSFRNGKPVPLNWVERDEPVLIREFLQGVGTPEHKPRH